MSANEVADFFILKGEIGGEAMSQLPLHKLLYLAQGWHLALLGKPLFEEPLHAWKHGPVERQLRERFRSRGDGAIHPSEAQTRPEEVFSEETLGFLEQVYRAYRNFTPRELVGISHFPGSPWGRARQRQRETDSDVIRVDELEVFFTNEFRDALDRMVVVEPVDPEAPLDEDALLEGAEVVDAPQGATPLR